MYILEIKSQHRRDFQCVYKCEHCSDFYTGGGYDDDNFHRNVIPAMECNSCGKNSSNLDKMRLPKYSSDVVI